MVALGCPHFSYDEFCRLANSISCLEGKRVASDVDFIVLTSQTSYSLLQRTEMLKLITDFGAKITLDTCVFHTPLASSKTKTLMTNSGKCAYYAPGELGVKVAFADIDACVRSAVEGYII